MNFREDSTKYRSQFISQPDAASKTDDYFIKTYIQRENKGPGPINFTGTFNPGSIYLFKYSKSMEESENKFISKIPVVLALNVLKKKGESYFYGIDLVTVPPFERSMILERIDDYLSKRGGNLSNSVLKKVLSRTGYESACFAYSPKRISDIVQINNSDWCKLPFASFALIEGSTQMEIYSNYRSKLK